MTGQKTILLATRNLAKEAKLRWLLDGLGYDVQTLGDRPEAVEPDEEGRTHRQVAAGKSLFWSKQTDGFAVASDGGARIPALGEGWNSLLTRRAAGADADDCARADHLLGLMRGRCGAERNVIWVEGVALARSGELLASWEVAGILGRLVETYDPRLIEGGFWMPGLIYVPRFGRVLAQLSRSELEEADHCWNELRRRLRAFLDGATRA